MKWKVKTKKVYDSVFCFVIVIYYLIYSRSYDWPDFCQHAAAGQSELQLLCRDLHTFVLKQTQNVKTGNKLWAVTWAWKH